LFSFSNAISATSPAGSNVAGALDATSTALVRNLGERIHVSTVARHLVGGRQLDRDESRAGKASLARVVKKTSATNTRTALTKFSEPMPMLLRKR
jgi:hypothetical protein